MAKIITAYITKTGIAQLGLTPTIKIWQIGLASDSVVVANDSLTEIGDGLYKYIFTTYDNRTTYGFIVDAGPSLPNNQRYHVAVNESYVEDIAFETWEEVDTDHDNPNTMGERLNDITSALLIVEEMIKYHKNRTKIDLNTYQLHVYDDDNITIIRSFDLKDENGLATYQRIFERLPA